MNSMEPRHRHGEYNSWPGEEERRHTRHSGSGTEEETEEEAESTGELIAGEWGSVKGRCWVMDDALDGLVEKWS